MPTFTFTDSQGRTYANLNGGPLVVVPGQTYTLDADPGDGRWTATTPAPEAPQTAPEAPVAPATPEATPTPTN